MDDGGIVKGGIKNSIIKSMFDKAMKEDGEKITIREYMEKEGVPEEEITSLEDMFDELDKYHASYITMFYEKLRFIKRSIRYFFQRWTRGWDDSDLWSLDQTISEFILPRLKEFKRTLHGYPGDMTEEEWNQILDKMIIAFELGSKGFWDVNEEDFTIAKEGLDLFAKHFFELWD